MKGGLFRACSGWCVGHRALIRQSLKAGRRLRELGWGELVWVLEEGQSKRRCSWQGAHSSLAGLGEEAVDCQVLAALGTLLQELFLRVWLLDWLL